MNRSLILIVALAGAIGLTIGWVATGSKPEPAVTHSQASAQSSVSTPFSDPQRIEFNLCKEDVANDRENPAVAIDGSGTAILAWAAQSGESERTLFLARSNDGGKTFESPLAFRKVPIYKYSSQSKGKAVSYSTHVLPRLAVTADGLYLGWVEAIKGGPEVAFYVARSVDHGKSFAEPVRTHGKEATKPGYTALTATSDGSLVTAWLDGRNKGQHPYFASRPAESEGFEPDRLVFRGPEEKGICPCCDLAVTRLPDGSDVVAFRNSDKGHRDIWISRAPKGGDFATPVPLSSDLWKFDGCPHDGPSLAVVGETLHAVWMSAFSGRNRVYAASSPTSELAFDPRELSPARSGAQGHPKIIGTRAGGVLAVWDESLDEAPAAKSTKETHGSGHAHGANFSGSGRAIMLAVKADKESSFETVSPVAARPGAFQLNPAIALGPDGAVLVAWSEIDPEGKRVVFVRREPVKDLH